MRTGTILMVTTGLFLSACDLTIGGKGYGLEWEVNECLTYDDTSGVGLDTGACDIDGDGYADVEQGGTDCNDDRNDINPGAEEVCGNSDDEDCDGEVDEGCDSGTGGDSGEEEEETEE